MTLIKEDLRKLDINLSYQEIKDMSKYKFSSLIKEKIRKKALNYLKEKQSKKGGKIQYKTLEIAEYLEPSNELTNKEKQKIFAIRNDMIDIPNNYGKEKTCLCGIKENTMHIYICEMWSKQENKKIPFNNIYNGNIQKQKNILKIFEHNLEKRNERMKLYNSHEILIGSTVDPS